MKSFICLLLVAVAMAFYVPSQVESSESEAVARHGHGLFGVRGRISAHRDARAERAGRRGVVFGRGILFGRCG